jgi:RimJ/RimL family protein N-acetyltransferase
MDAPPFDPVTLEGRLVRLEPLSPLHKEGLSEAIRDGELWKLFVTLVPHPDEVDRFLLDARRAYNAGDGLAFATVDRASGRVIGSTRFMSAHVRNRRVEIGYTFLGGSWQRTGCNLEAKLLMLTHAFEVLKMNRVELLTDFLNQKSRRAILGLGAREEGVLRSHMIMPDGRVRDSVVYSVVQSEWHGVRQHLNSRLAARGGSSKPPG